MSCESNPNRIARLACTGISLLSSKRGFYAGLALGGMGLAGLLALAKRGSALRPAPGRAAPGPTPAGGARQQIPQLQARQKIRPTGSIPAADRCAGCRTPAGSKTGPWYALDGRSYCPDCAPQAAAKAGVDLLLPERETFVASASRPDSVVVSHRSAASSTSGTPIASASPRQPEYLPAEGLVKTKLIPSRIRLCVGLDGDRPVWLVAENGQVVLRLDGRDTGLAITPSLKLPERPGEPVQEDTRQWWLTHISSGKTLGSQPYESLEEVGLLAGLLAQVDWTRDEAELTTAELKKVNTTIAMFNQLLAEEKKKRQATISSSLPPAHTPDPTLPAAPEGGNPSPPAQTGESLVGKIVADDGYGGIVRVLADDGTRLLVIDSLGSRYEVERARVRPPAENDFEAVRVAMSFDPLERPAEKCARCGRLAGQTTTGETWHRMGWKSYCPACATSYAVQEGYEMDAEIGSEI